MSRFIIKIENDKINVSVEADDVNLGYYHKELLAIVDNAVNNALKETTNV